MPARADPRTRHTDARAEVVGFDDAEHYLFPWHGRDKKIDPSRPMTTWRSAWRSLRKAAGLDHVRFHDGRHTALTRLAEKGQPDWVIQAQMGHVSPAMMRTYSHIRRKALDEAAAALEPSFELVFPADPRASTHGPKPASYVNGRDPRGLTSLRQGFGGPPELQRRRKPALYVDKPTKTTSHERCNRLMSQFTSQWDDLKKEIRRNEGIWLLGLDSNQQPSG